MEEEMSWLDRIRGVLGGNQGLAARPLQVGGTPFPQVVGNQPPAPAAVAKESAFPPNFGIPNMTPVPQQPLPGMPPMAPVPPAPISSQPQTLPATPKALGRKQPLSAKVKNKGAAKKPAPKAPSAPKAPGASVFNPQAYLGGPDGFKLNLANELGMDNQTGGAPAPQAPQAPVSFVDNLKKTLTPPGHVTHSGKGEKPGDQYIGVPTPKESASEKLTYGNEAMQALTPNLMENAAKATAGGFEPEKQAGEQAKLAGMQATDTNELIRQYHDETDRVKKNQLWDAIIRGAGQIAAGVGSLATGYDVAGAYQKMAPEPYNPETDLKVAQSLYDKGQMKFAEYIKALQAANAKKYEQKQATSQLGASPGVQSLYDMVGKGADTREQTRSADQGTDVQQAYPATSRERIARAGAHVPPAQPTSLSPGGTTVNNASRSLADQAGKISAGTTNFKEFTDLLSNLAGDTYGAGFNNPALQKMWDEELAKNRLATGHELAAAVMSRMQQVLALPPMDRGDSLLEYQNRVADINKRYGTNIHADPYQSGKTTTAPTNAK